MLYDVDIEASACVLSSRYAMLCSVNNIWNKCMHAQSHTRAPNGQETMPPATLRGAEALQ